MELDKHIEAFDKVLNKKWNCKIKRRIDNNMYKLIGITYSKNKWMDYDRIRDTIYKELLAMYYASEYDKKFDSMKSSLPTYVKIFIDSHLKGLLKAERREKDMSYDNDEYDDEIYYPGENSDLESDYEAREKIKLLQKYAEDNDKLDEYAILVGLKDYEYFAEKYSKHYDVLRQRVSRLRKDFEVYYEELV